jgi:predicted dehydrogenase
MSVPHESISLAELGLPDRFAMPSRGNRGIGMVGFGGIGRGAHAPAYLAAGWPIVAVADVDPEARRVAQAEFGIPAVYENWRDLVPDEAVEVVDLLTQPTLRVEVVEEAVRVGKPVITEKPFARTLDECARMVFAAERAGVALGVHQNYRWIPNCYLAHHIVRQGWIGRPFYASIEIYGTQDEHLAGHAFYSKCDDFLTIQWNNHLADLLRYWVGCDAKRVFARTSRMAEQSFVSDNLLCVFADFGPGLTGHILHSELLRSPLVSQPCRIDGDGGSLVFDMSNGLLTLASARLGGAPRAIDSSSTAYPSSFAGSMGDFLTALEDGREPAVCGKSNLATIRTILAEHASAVAGGMWVDVNNVAK